MRKLKETNYPESCLNKALSLELIFVLLGRDECAPLAIRAWCNERIRLGKNQPSDPQILEAYELANDMDFERRAGAYKI